MVWPEARRPHNRGDLPAGEIQFEGRAGIDAGGPEAAWRREGAIEAGSAGPLVSAGQETVHLQVGQSAYVSESAGELGYPVRDAAEAAGNADALRAERVKVGRGALGGSGELGGG